MGASSIFRLLWAAASAAAVMLALAAGASAAGTAINIGTPYESTSPSVAVNSSGTALIAWANQKGLNGAYDFVQYCVLPVGASACSQSGNLTPAAGAQATDDVQALSEGSTFVILADVFGTQGNNSGNYVPEQEWQSTDGGASFNIVNGGLSVSDGIVDADTEPVGAVTVPGTGELGYTWVTAEGPPTFNAFPLSSPPECSANAAPSPCPAGYATLEPASNPDQIGNLGGSIASELSPTPGVLGIYENLNSNGPLACSKGEGFAYAYGAGDESPTNDYNVSPGSTGSAWKSAVQEGDCDVEEEVAGGGPSGLGVFEQNDGTSVSQYHAFDATNDTFDTKPVTVNASGEVQPSVSQDSSGGIYLTYLQGGNGGPITLSYSADGGKTWTTGPVNADSDNGASGTTSSVSAAGQGWVAWDDNGSVFAQSFTAAEAITPAAVAGSASSNGQTVSINVTCASYPCTVSVTLTAPETVTIHASLARMPFKKGKSKTKTKTVTLGSGRFTIKSKSATKLTVSLSGAGKSFLKSKKGRIKISAQVTEKFGSHSAITKKTLSLTVKHSPAKGKKK